MFAAIRCVASFLLVSLALLGQSATWQPFPMLGMRHHHTMAYDAASDRAFVFGGTRCDYGTRNDLWMWDGYSWLLRRSAMIPQRRALARLVHDPMNNGVMLLFGFDYEANQRVMDQLWWDGREWRSVSPAVMPAWRWEQMMAADPVRRRVVMFGGALSASGPLLDETWEWDGKAWTLLQPATRPTARRNGAMAYCGATGKMVLVGGGWLGGYSDVTWEFDGVTWQQYPGPSPSPRVYPALCATPWDGKVLLHGGGDNSWYNDTWSWDGVTWTQLSPFNRPHSRRGPQMMPNVALRQVAMYGGEVDIGLSSGVAGTDPGDKGGSTWVFVNSNWKRLAYLDPPLLEEAWTALEESPPRDRLLFFDSHGNGLPLVETWVLEGGKFREIPTPSWVLVPGGRIKGACHEGLGKTVILGSYINGWYPAPATYVFDGATWTGAPSLDMQNGMEITYDPDRQALVTMKINGEVYEWRSGALGWTLRPEAQATFPRSNAFMLCYERGRHRLVCAGSTSSLVQPGTWEFDGTSWQSIPTAAGLPQVDGGIRSRYVPELGGIVAVLRTYPQREMEVWFWNGTGWSQIPTERPLPLTEWPHTIMYDRLHGRIRMMSPNLCWYDYSESNVWDLEFRSLLPSTHHPRLGECVIFTIEQRTQPNRFFGVLLSGGNWPGIPLPGSPQILPLRNDGLLATGLWPGMFGMLDAQGRSTASLQISHAPALVGLHLHCAMVTLEPTGAIGSVSNEVELDINR